MRRESIIKKYREKYKGDQSDNVVLHLELKELEKRYKKEKRYDKQTKDLFEELNKVLCSDWPNLEFLVVDLLGELAKTKKKPVRETMKWYANKTERWFSDYLLHMIKEQGYFTE